MTKRQRRHARRAANKRARGGRTIAQCVVAVMKTMRRGVSIAAVQKALAKKGIKVASFALNKVVLRHKKGRFMAAKKAKKAGKKARKAKKSKKAKKIQEDPTIAQVSSLEPAFTDKLVFYRWLET